MGARPASPLDCGSFSSLNGEEESLSLPFSNPWLNREEHKGGGNYGCDEDDDDGDEEEVESESESATSSSSSFLSQELLEFQARMKWLGFYLVCRFPTLPPCLLFLALSIAFPALASVFVVCRGCRDPSMHRFEMVVQLSETAIATIAFFSLLHILQSYGIEGLLLLHDVQKESPNIQKGYKREIRSAFRLLVKILVPFLLVELAYKLVFFMDSSVEVLSVERINNTMGKLVICFISMFSWVYRSAVFLLMCVLFRLLCSFQILRLCSYTKLFKEDLPISFVLQEHMRLRGQLIAISHRFRLFVVSSLITITLSQFATLFEVVSSLQSLSFVRTGGVLVCSGVQVIGFVVCLHGAAKITHRSQKIVSFVSQWHAMETCFHSGKISVFDSISAQRFLRSSSSPVLPHRCAESDPLHLCCCNPASSDDSYYYQKRFALVTYLQHCHTGISLYGFVLDRGCIYAIFVLELSIILWTLGRTVTF